MSIRQNQQPMEEIVGPSALDRLHLLPGLPPALSCHLMNITVSPRSVSDLDAVMDAIGPQKPILTPRLAPDRDPSPGQSLVEACDVPQVLFIRSSRPNL